MRRGRAVDHWRDDIRRRQRISVEESERAQHVAQLTAVALVVTHFSQRGPDSSDLPHAQPGIKDQRAQLQGDGRTGRQQDL